MANPMTEEEIARLNEWHLMWSRGDDSMFVDGRNNVANMPLDP